MKLPRGFRLRDWNWWPVCPGLKPGWFLLGDAEMWYPSRPCDVRINLLRDLYIGVCRDCSVAFDRRGFRVNYAVKP